MEAPIPDCLRIDIILYRFVSPLPQKEENIPSKPSLQIQNRILLRILSDGDEGDWSREKNSVCIFSQSHISAW